MSNIPKRNLASGCHLLKKLIKLHGGLLDVTTNIYLKSCAYCPDSECCSSFMGIWATWSPLKIHWYTCMSFETCWSRLIARNQGQFEPANNYQRYIVLHSGTIVNKEKSIWRRSKLDLQRSVSRTMTYTIWAPQIFYFMKRRRKEDLQVNLWDFSRQSELLQAGRTQR